MSFDSLEFTFMLGNPKLLVVYLGHERVLSNMMDMLALRSFSLFAVNFVRREANSVAHCCASKPSRDHSVFSWSSHLPVWLTEVAAKDCNLASINE